MRTGLRRPAVTGRENTRDSAIPGAVRQAHRCELQLGCRSFGPECFWRHSEGFHEGLRNQSVVSRSRSDVEYTEIAEGVTTPEGTYDLAVTHVSPYVG